MAPVVDKVGMGSGIIASYLPAGTVREKGDGASKQTAPQNRVEMNFQKNSAVNDAKTEENASVAGKNSADLKTIQQLEAENNGTRVTCTSDKETGMIIVRVINKDTGEVVREYPPEEVQNAAKVLQQLAAERIDADKKGQLVDQIVT